MGIFMFTQKLDFFPSFIIPIKNGRYVIGRNSWANIYGEVALTVSPHEITEFAKLKKNESYCALYDCKEDSWYFGTISQDWQVNIPSYKSDFFEAMDYELVRNQTNFNESYIRAKAFDLPLIVPESHIKKTRPMIVNRKGKTVFTHMDIYEGIFYHLDKYTQRQFPCRGNNAEKAILFDHVTKESKVFEFDHQTVYAAISDDVTTIAVVAGQNLHIIDI